MIKWSRILVGVLALVLALLWLSQPDIVDTRHPKMPGISSSHI
jgi:hypothetical protein